MSTRSEWMEISLEFHFSPHFFLFIQLSAWWYISMLMTDDNSFTIFFPLFDMMKKKSESPKTHNTVVDADAHSSPILQPLVHPSMAQLAQPDIHHWILDLNLYEILDKTWNWNMWTILGCDRSFSVLLLSLEHVSKDFPTRSVEETRSKSSRDERPTTTLFFSIEFFRCCWTLSRSHIHPRHRRRWAAMLSCRAI